jgi:hypothetical protein
VSRGTKECEFISPIEWIELNELVKMMMLAFGTISSELNAVSIKNSSAVNIEESSISLNFSIFVGVTSSRCLLRPVRINRQLSLILSLA